MQLEAARIEFGYAKDHTPASQQWYRNRLGAFFTWAGEQGIDAVEGITAPLVRRYLDYRRPGLSSHTLHGHARAIKAFLNWAVFEGLLDEVVPKRIALPKREQKVIAVFTDDQLDRLFAACEQPRDAAILAVLLDTGVRAAELCSLTLDNTHFTPEGAYLLIRGKGRKEREVPLGRKARQRLHRYIYRSRPRTTSRAVFVSAQTSGPLTPFGLDELLYRLRDRAGREHFTGIRVSAHTFRHCFAVRSLEAGVDLYRLSRLMGHSSVAVTEGYLKAVTSRQARQGVASVLDSL